MSAEWCLVMLSSAVIYMMKLGGTSGVGVWSCGRVTPVGTPRTELTKEYVHLGHKHHYAHVSVHLQMSTVL